MKVSCHRPSLTASYPSKVTRSNATQPTEILSPLPSMTGQREASQVTSQPTTKLLLIRREKKNDKSTSQSCLIRRFLVSSFRSPSQSNNIHTRFVTLICFFSHNWKARVPFQSIPILFTILFSGFEETSQPAGQIDDTPTQQLD